MMRLPRLLGLGSLLALPLMMQAFVSCGGRLAERRIITESDASAEPLDATPVNADAAGLTCADPIHVAIGETLNGSTCGGALLPAYLCGDQHPHPAFYFVVDAPNTAHFHVVLVGGPTTCGGEEFLSVYSYDSCGGMFAACTSGGEFNGLSGTPLLAVVRWDVPCGDFTISVAAGN